MFTFIDLTLSCIPQYARRQKKKAVSSSHLLHKETEKERVFFFSVEMLSVTTSRSEKKTISSIAFFSSLLFSVRSAVPSPENSIKATV